MVPLPSMSISVSASAMVCAIVASFSLCAAEACARLRRRACAEPARDICRSARRRRGGAGAREGSGGGALDSMVSVELSILRILISSISPELSSSYASKMILNFSSGVPLCRAGGAELRPSYGTCLSRASSQRLASTYSKHTTQPTYSPDIEQLAATHTGCMCRRMVHVQCACTVWP